LEDRQIVGHKAGMASKGIRFPKMLSRLTQEYVESGTGQCPNFKKMDSGKLCLSLEWLRGVGNGDQPNVHDVLARGRGWRQFLSRVAKNGAVLCPKWFGFGVFGFGL